MDLADLHDPERYARVLQVFEAFLAGWEPAVASALPRWQPWLAGRSRRPFLQQDLRWLGLAAPAAIDPPALPTAAAAWGSVYVLEGSALGGQVITRSLAGAGLHPGAGASYFHGWGDATGAMWREFRTLLEAQLRGPRELAEACAAAQATFDTLSATLEDALHERTPVA